LRSSRSSDFNGDTLIVQSQITAEIFFVWQTKEITSDNFARETVCIIVQTIDPIGIIRQSQTAAQQQQRQHRRKVRNENEKRMNKESIILEIFDPISTLSSQKKSQAREREERGASIQEALA
jgi:hypothetical protein